MSDTELSDVPVTKVPSDRALEKALRKETTKQFEDPLKEVTVNSVRKGTEEALDVDIGFFVNDEAWKARSKTIIKKVIELLENAAEEKEDKSSSRTVSANPSPAKSKVTKSTSKAATKKRPSPATEKPPKKRQKKSSPKEDSAAELSSHPAEDSEVELQPKGKKTNSRPRIKDDPPAKASRKAPAISEPKSRTKRQDSKSDLSDASADSPEKKPPPKHLDDDSGSELSVLMDEEPQAKKKRKNKDSSDKLGNAAKAKLSASDDPEQEEIKRLQGWLVKCGIRKIWAFELKPYETSKAKVKHLKEMLSNIGMTGRYSLEKASQIKEARELAADIEAVQEGNEIWGKDGEDRARRSKRSDHADADEYEDDEDRAPKKKLVRGPKRYDFLSSDGEESD